MDQTRRVPDRARVHRKLAAVLFLLSAASTACIDRARVNTRCEWSAEDPRPLDVEDWPQQRHLYDDVALAEELAIRYADTVHEERFGSDAHGGLIEGGRLRERCMATLVGAIASTHRLTDADVERARARGYRDPRWDTGVLLSFVAVYVALAWLGVRQIARRIPAESGWFALAAHALAAIPAGLAGVQLLSLWSGALEVARLGNGHISSFRTAKSPWAGHGVAEWAAAALLFLTICTIERRRALRRAPADA